MTDDEKSGVESFEEKLEREKKEAEELLEAWDDAIKENAERDEAKKKAELTKKIEQPQPTRTTAEDIKYDPKELKYQKEKQRKEDEFREEKWKEQPSVDKEGTSQKYPPNVMKSLETIAIQNKKRVLLK